VAVKQLSFDALSELLVEVAVLVGSALGSGLLALLGILAENAALQHVATGRVVLGVWLLAAGAIALGAGVIVGYRECYPRAERLTARLRSSDAR
jgi:hypothetical protein